MRVLHWRVLGPIFFFLLACVGSVTWMLGLWGQDSSGDDVTSGPPLVYPIEDAEDAEVTMADAVAALKSAYETVSGHKDYIARFTKRERVDGTLKAAETIRLKVRHEPFGVYMRFLKPSGVEGQQAIYAEGLNDDKLVAHGAGLRRLIGTFRLPPTDPLATAGNRHTITSVGIKNLLKKMIADKEGPQEGVTVASAKTEVAGRPATMWQFTYAQPSPGKEAHISRIVIDNEWNVPVQYVAYGFPAEDEDKPPLLEEYQYENFEFDTGLTDEDFDPENPAYDFP
jgi:hypothetical protein